MGTGRFCATGNLPPSLSSRIDISILATQMANGATVNVTAGALTVAARYNGPKWQITTRDNRVRDYGVYSEQDGPGLATSSSLSWPPRCGGSMSSSASFGNMIVDGSENQTDHIYISASGTTHVVQ